MAKLTYRDAGVDVRTKGEFTDGIYHLMRRTFGPRVIENPDGFGGLFSLCSDSRLFEKNYRQPVLVGCCDGVGTKLKIAFMMDKHDTVGIDLVAMNVNDLIVQGAEPLFFLDYMAMSKLEPKKLLEVFKGIVAGCEQADCALLGGETPEMPGFYAPGEYELAGFAVGAVERDRIIDGKSIEPGDLLIGISSSGVHSNGYSLVRRIFFEKAKMSVADRVPELGATLGEELLRPTKIYVHAVKGLLRHYRTKKVVKGMAHITGGAMPDNLPRILPPKCAAKIEKGSWPIPPIFHVIRKVGEVEEREMYHVFNMGIGMILVVPPFYADSVVHQLRRVGERGQVIGKIVRGNRDVNIV